MRAMRILVTGAAGFIGSHVAEKLASLGHEVGGLDCLTDYYDPAVKEQNVRDLAGAGVGVRRLDLAEDDLAEAVAGVDVVYHFAAQPGISAAVPMSTYIRNNLIATHRLLEALRLSAPLKCFVNCSTSSVYGAHATDTEETPPKPTSYYGVTKLAAEQLALAYHREHILPCCSVRLFSVYGPRERPEKLYPRLIRSILEDQELPLFEGSESHSRAFTFVADVVHAMVAALDRLDRLAGEIVNIGCDTAITTLRGIQIVEEILGRRARIVRQARRSGDQLHTRANIEKARRLLDYSPRTTPEVGLAAEVDWCVRSISKPARPHHP
jgi:nucleoside-diphosphate-sugar epimerase